MNKKSNRWQKLLETFLRVYDKKFISNKEGIVTLSQSHYSKPITIFKDRDYIHVQIGEIYNDMDDEVYAFENAQQVIGALKVIFRYND